MTTLLALYDRELMSCHRETAYTEEEMHGLFVLWPERMSSQVVQALDGAHLSQQRWAVLTVLKTLRGAPGWEHAPGVWAWYGHETALMRHGMRICRRMSRIGYVDTLLPHILSEQSFYGPADHKGVLPSWSRDDTIRSSHRAYLMRHLPEHYGGLWPNEDPSQELIIPKGPVL